MNASRTFRHASTASLKGANCALKICTSSYRWSCAVQRGQARKTPRVPPAPEAGSGLGASFRVDSLVRFVQHLGDVHHACRDARISHCRFVLHLTAGVGRDDDVWPVLLELS